MENEKNSYSDFLDRMNILNSGGKLQCPYCGEGFIARIEDGVYSCDKCGHGMITRTRLDVPEFNYAI